MRLSILVVAVAVCLSGSLVRGEEKPAKPELKVTGPYKHKNLSIFLFHGPDRMKGRKFLTLQEALDKKLVTVDETSNVNELSIENTGDVDVYIQSGDIVKGGKQDRTIAYDLILPSKSGKKPLDAFCVEHGRWRQRGEENAAGFATAHQSLASKDLKLAAKSAGDQQQVWSKVAEQQEKLGRSTGRNVQAAESASSYQLTLENKDIQKLADEYMKALAGCVEGKEDVVGYAFAIDGKVNSIDIYASPDLFRQLWPKLVRASSVEAIAEGKDQKYTEATVDDVRKCMADAEQAQAKEKAVSDRTKMRVNDAPAAAKFETLDEKEGDWVHQNYIKK